MTTIAEEAAFEQKAEKMLSGQRELPNGRDFRWNSFRFRDEWNDEFEKKFYDTFPGSPGSKEWWDKKFGKKKEKEGLKTGYHAGGGLFGKT